MFRILFATWRFLHGLWSWRNEKVEIPGYADILSVVTRFRRGFGCSFLVIETGHRFILVKHDGNVLMSFVFLAPFQRKIPMHYSCRIPGHEQEQDLNWWGVHGSVFGPTGAGPVFDTTIYNALNSYVDWVLREGSGGRVLLTVAHD